MNCEKGRVTEPRNIWLNSRHPGWGEEEARDQTEKIGQGQNTRDQDD